MQEEEVVKGEAVEEERRKRIEEEAKKEESKVKVPQKVGKEAEIISLKEEHTVVPLIKLEKVSELGLKGLEVSKEVPQVEKREITISIPIIKLQESSLMLKECELDYKLPKIEKRKRVLTVSMIRVNPLPKISFLLTEFDSEIRKPQQIILPKIKIPIYRKGIFISPKFLLETFDSAVNEQLIRRLERREEELPLRVEMETAEPMTPSPSVEKEEFPDFLEFAFGSGGGRIRARGPKIILFKDFEDDSYINFLENVCLRVYREIEGGEPKAVKIRKLDDMNKREIEKWLEAGGKIFTIDMEECEMPDETHLWEKLEETYTAKLGFIIFTVRKYEKFEHLERLLQEINRKSQGRLDIIVLEARRLPLKLIELSSGIIKLEKLPTHTSARVEVGLERVPSITTFDYMFNEAFFKEESLFNKAFEEIKKEENGLFRESTNPAKEIESPLHFNIKVFLVMYLVHKLRKEGERLSTREEIMRRIETEEELTKQITPDIRVGNEVYEVETLFGPHAGGEPDLKINETVDKYDKTSGITRVNIVMDNFCCLLHLSELLKKKEHFKGKKFDVEFYTLDLQNKKLKSISDFAKEVARVIATPTRPKEP